MGRNAYCMRFRPVPSEGESFMASKQKILIVDDDNNIAELISLYLTKECYDTKIVNDGEEAVREFHSFQPNLILLDLMLPGMDGYQVCREIRHDSDVPIIMLSAKGESASAAAESVYRIRFRCDGIYRQRKMCHRIPGYYSDPVRCRIRHYAGKHPAVQEGTGGTRPRHRNDKRKSERCPCHPCVLP